jgi:hypothetical protein
MKAQKNETFDDNCYLSVAICNITTNVENDYHSAHDEMRNEIFTDARVKRIILYLRSFTCPLVTSYTLKMAAAGLK